MQNCKVSKINAFYAEIQDGCQKWQENHFWEKMARWLCGYPGSKKFCRNQKMVGKQLLGKSPLDSADTLGVKNFIETALCRTTYKLNAFLHFTQKFEMAPKQQGKQFG